MLDYKIYAVSNVKFGRAKRTLCAVAYEILSRDKVVFSLTPSTDGVSENTA